MMRDDYKKMKIATATENQKRVLEFIKQNQYISTTELSYELNISAGTILAHCDSLKRTGYINFISNKPYKFEWTGKEGFDYLRPIKNLKRYNEIEEEKPDTSHLNNLLKQWQGYPVNV
jgi:Mn-dependent DtxR family transcriptional regulator